MPAARKNDSHDRSNSRRRPAVTLDAREEQLVSLATDLAEKQMSEGTASAQVITHYLRLGTTRERLEQQKLRNEVHLLEVRAEQAATGKNIEELYGKAISAMRSYAGDPQPQDDDDDY